MALAFIKNYYVVLGVASTATISEIKRAYRSLVKSLHPDRTSDKQAHARLMEVKEAYDFLSKPFLRAQLDAQLRSEVTEDQLQNQAQTGYELFAAGAAIVAYQRLVQQQNDAA